MALDLATVERSADLHAIHEQVDGHILAQGSWLAGEPAVEPDLEDDRPLPEAGVHVPVQATPPND